MFANHFSVMSRLRYRDMVRVIPDDFREVCEGRQVVEVCITELVLFLDRLCRLTIRFAFRLWSRSGREEAFADRDRLRDKSNRFKSAHCVCPVLFSVCVPLPA